MLRLGFLAALFAVANAAAPASPATCKACQAPASTPCRDAMAKSCMSGDMPAFCMDCIAGESPKCIQSAGAYLASCATPAAVALPETVVVAPVATAGPEACVACQAQGSPACRDAMASACMSANMPPFCIDCAAGQTPKCIQSAGAFLAKCPAPKAPVAPITPVTVTLANLGIYPNYTGAAVIAGGAQLTFQGTSVQIGYRMSGTEKCAAGAGTSANSCGIHIHAGKSCNDGQGHYFVGAADPWVNVVYSQPQGMVSVDYGADYAATEGRVLVVHDYDGKRVTCAMITKTPSVGTVTPVRPVVPTRPVVPAVPVTRPVIPAGPVTPINSGFLPRPSFPTINTNTIPSTINSFNTFNTLPRGIVPINTINNNNFNARPVFNPYATLARPSFPVGTGIGMPINSINTINQPFPINPINTINPGFISQQPLSTFNNFNNFNTFNRVGVGAPLGTRPASFPVNPVNTGLYGG